MTTDGFPRPLDWKELYQLAMLELDPAKLPSAIAKANDAILERIEHTDRNAFGSELPTLNDALNGLRVLRREYERGTKEYGEPDQRKRG